MADTTIKVSTDVRDRLAVLAAERGTTIRDIVDQLAAATPTQAELQQRQEHALEYIRAHLRPDFGPDDIAAGHQIWDNISVGRLTTRNRGEGKRSGGSDGEAA